MRCLRWEHSHVHSALGGGDIRPECGLIHQSLSYWYIGNNGRTAAVNYWFTILVWE